MASAFVVTVALATVSGPVEARPSARLLGGDLGATIETQLSAGSTSSACQADTDCVQEILGAGVLASLRLWVLELGLVVDTASWFFSAEHIHMGMVAGVAMNPLRWMRVELLAELGAHEIRGQALPYVGLRLGWSVRGGRGAFRPVVGAWVALRRDAEVRQVELLESDDWCWTGCEPYLEEYRFGGTTALVGVRLGVELR